MTRVWHPGIESEGGPAFADVDESAVPILRNSGWLLASERDEHVDRIAAHPSQNADAKAEAEAGDKASRAKPSTGKTAGGSGSEGS